MQPDYEGIFLPVLLHRLRAERTVCKGYVALSVLARKIPRFKLGNGLVGGYLCIGGNRGIIHVAYGEHAGDIDRHGGNIFPVIVRLIYERAEVAGERPAGVTYRVLYRHVLRFGRLRKFVAFGVGKVHFIVISAERSAPGYREGLIGYGVLCYLGAAEIDYGFGNGRAAFKSAHYKLYAKVAFVGNFGCGRSGLLSFAAGRIAVCRSKRKGGLYVKAVDIGNALRLCRNNERVEPFLYVEFAKVDGIPVIVPRHRHLPARAAERLGIEMRSLAVEREGDVSFGNGLVVNIYSPTAGHIKLCVVAGRTQSYFGSAGLFGPERKRERIARNAEVTYGRLSACRFLIGFDKAFAAVCTL